MSKLPANWIHTPIGEIVELNPRNEVADDTIVGFTPMPLLGKSFRETPTFEPRLWREVKKGYTHFIDGDVLLAKITPCFENGKAGIPLGLPNGIGAGSTEYFVCRTNSSVILSKYLLAYFKTVNFLRYGESAMTGSVGHKRVPKNYILETKIPLAPLNEQKRIADKLDRLLSRVDACRERCDRIPLILKHFRQSVLAAATSGELTEDWRGENFNIESASDLLIRLQEQFRGNFIHRIWTSPEEKGSEALPESWLYVPVKAVGEVYLGRQRSPKNHNGPNMRPYVRAANITWTGWDFSDVKEMNFDPPDFERYRLRVGDVLINEGSGSADEVGKPAIWKGEIENCCFQNTLICVRPYEDMSEYLYLVFLQAALSKAFVEATRGINIHHIGKERFAAFLIPFPPLEEQQEIVRRVEKLFAFVDRLEARYQTARAQVDRLTPALLDKAFRGELVPQEPNDEPASVLLARIRAEQDASSTGF